MRGLKCRNIPATSTGAAVRLTDQYGEVYEYEVYNMQTIAPDEVDALEDCVGKHDLELITCTTGGENCLLVRNAGLTNDMG